MQQLFIRTASVDDVPTLYRWDEKPHVKRATSNDGSRALDVNWEDELQPRDDGTECLIAEIDSFPIGMVQIINPATERTHYWGIVPGNLRAIDIWIGEEDFIGQGYGSRMMTYAIERCFSEPDVAAILIDPLAGNTKSHRFYRRFGFEFIERRQFDDDSDCFVFRLDRRRWETRYR